MVLFILFPRSFQSCSQVMASVCIKSVLVTLSPRPQLKLHWDSLAWGLEAGHGNLPYGSDFFPRKLSLLLTSFFPFYHHYPLKFIYSAILPAYAKIPQTQVVRIAFLPRSNNNTNNAYLKCASKQQANPPGVLNKQFNLEFLNVSTTFYWLEKWNGSFQGALAAKHWVRAWL